MDHTLTHHAETWITLLLIIIEGGVHCLLHILFVNAHKKNFSPKFVQCCKDSEHVQEVYAQHGLRSFLLLEAAILEQQ